MTLSKLTILLVLLILATSDLVSQEVPPPPPPVRMGDGSGTGKKAPGATVRGRLVYEDTGAPIRYAMIGFSAVGSRGYASETVQTDENGNFVFENLAPGEYYPVVRNRGILNPEAFVDPTLSVAQRTEKLNRFFQKIAVEGTGEFEVFLRAKRGASISGVVRYFDGEAAVGVTVEALPVIDGFPLNRVFSGSQGPNSEKTDDRGFYRFAGLPEGQYVVRVTEPVTHRNEKVRYSGFLSNPFSENPFQTYYPAGSSNRNADRIDAFYGQTAEGVNITLPERNLYDVSGIVIRADTRQPLKNFEVTFTPVVVVDDDGEDETPKFSAKR
ncbi:MAG: carboxypeptidase-like regulatory domain-containing protein, partial [Acidobacteriota bacterium]|nr:carboxypeptidase-like regulatory domain-containing protein [Acidobacteriota bacterium]